MAYPYVCKADVEKKYDGSGFSKIEMPLDADFEEIRRCDIKFYRCNLKAGCSVSPQLEEDKIVMLIFNGKRSYVHCGDEVFHVTEPSFFIPDFDKQSYRVGAVEDAEFIMGVFGMNEWDKEHYVRWHKHLPFFVPYTEAVQYDQDCKQPGTRSWTILQGMQLGHVTAGVVYGIGAGTDEKGHPEVHQWNYCLGDSDFDLDVEGESEKQGPGDFSFIYGGRDHKLLAAPEKEVFYVWIEWYTSDDLTEYWLSSCRNETPKEAYARILEKQNKEAK